MERKRKTKHKEERSRLGLVSREKDAYGELVLKQSGSLLRLVGHVDSGLRG